MNDSSKSTQSKLDVPARALQSKLDVPVRALAINRLRFLREFSEDEPACHPKVIPTRNDYAARLVR